MDIHFNAYKIKYELLNSFIRPILTSQPIKTINIFIDLDDFFHSLHRPLTNNEFQVCGVNANKQLISNIFNLIGHYRNWAMKNRLDVKIFGIYTTTLRSFKNNIYIENYRKRFKDINDPTNASFYFVNEAIKNSVHLLPIISEYIPGVYLIDSKYIEPSVLPLYISKEYSSAHWNILISRDTYNLQYCYKDKWSLISPKGNNSIFVKKTDLWDYLNQREKIYKDPIELKYDYRLYIFAKAVVGDKFRNIPRLRKIGWKTLFNYLDEVIESSSDKSYTNTQIKLLDLLQNGKKVTDDEINNNLSSVSVEHQLETFNEIDRNSILNQMKDIPDYENLSRLNLTQFIKFPINLHFLCSESINNKNKTPFG